MELDAFWGARGRENLPAGAAERRRRCPVTLSRLQWRQRLGENPPLFVNLGGSIVFFFWRLEAVDSALAIIGR